LRFAKMKVKSVVVMYASFENLFSIYFY